MKDSLDSIDFSTKRLLVVAAHPDDETLGAGGTIAKLTNSGQRCTVVFLTDGVSSRNNSDINASTRRRMAAEEAMQVLGVNDVFFGSFPDNQLDTVPMLELAQYLESFDVAKFETLITHSPRDLNADHRLTSEALTVASRPQFGVPHRILNFEVLSSTNWQPANAAATFSPNWFVDISSTLDLKIRALEAYKEEMRDWPHSRSVRALTALAEYRGSTCGFLAAEAFELSRLSE